MGQDINLPPESRAAEDLEIESAPRMVYLRWKQCIRTYALLVLDMVIATFLVTRLCVLIIRDRRQAQMTVDLSQDIEHSVNLHKNVQITASDCFPIGRRHSSISHACGMTHIASDCRG